MKSLLKLLKKKNLFPGAKHIIVYAFTCGGIDYYQFEDVFNLPYQRALQSLVYYKEIGLNCSKDFLQAHVEAIRNCLTPTVQKKVIDINAAYVLNEQLSQRLTLPPDPELLYKLASVVFFDANEKPETYEFGYGARKIEHWKKHSDIDAFFLQQPIQVLIPFLSEYQNNISTFQSMMEKVNQRDTVNLLANLSEQQKKTYLGK